MADNSTSTTPSDQKGSNLIINFTHVPTGMSVSFLAFLETFNDSFDAEWSSEKVFGRMDPIAQYKGTTRKINCSFTIPSISHTEAFINHIKISQLLQMMYPTYEAVGGLSVYNIAAPPLMIVKFNNMIRDQSNKNRGLLGYIPSLKYEPDMNSNIFTFDSSNIEKNELEVYKSMIGNSDSFLSISELQKDLDNDNERIGWQSLKVNFELNVLHTHRLGYKKGSIDGTFRKFPYGAAILGK